MYKIISSGSDGNAVLYFDNILVDCGVPYSLLSDYVSRLSIVLLTHVHGDHLNLSTIQRLSFERPSLRFGCGAHLVGVIKDVVKNVDVYDVGTYYNYGSFKVCPVLLYHDVLNFGYRIIKGEKKVFHATDTSTLEGISAKGYDVYSLEANYDEDRVFDVIREKEMYGGYAHQRGAMNSHLSIQQAQNFVLQNAGRDYKFLCLHQSKEF